ncbi:MAG TPA: hypothetical protein VGK73_01935 [Polyangiaceae bacterium]
MAEPASPPLPPGIEPPGSAEYERWLAQRPPPEGGYLFSEAHVRFEARDGDRLACAPGLVCEPSAGGARLRLPGRSVIVDVPGARAPALAKFLALCDGERTLKAAVAEAALAVEERARLLRVAFGVVLFAPAAVAELEAEVPSSELVRFPGVPYELDRNYWSNMVDVRRRLPELETRLENPIAALEELERLHAIALLGASGGSFYRPASPIAGKGVHPGRLWQAETRLAESDGGVKFLSGPRVNAVLLGGEHYAALLAEHAGDPEALAPRRDHRDEAGLAWGRVVTARAEHDPAAAPWFCPPRPFGEPHVRSLIDSLRAVLDQTTPAPAIAALADFHQKFVRLHPFRAANQSLAMNLVNAMLHRIVGAGMPHLILDQLALRFSAASYRRLFALAVRGHALTGSPLERYRELVARKQRSFALIGSLQDADGLEQARLIAAARPEDARLALIDA